MQISLLTLAYWAETATYIARFSGDRRAGFKGDVLQFSDVIRHLNLIDFPIRGPSFSLGPTSEISSSIGERLAVHLDTTLIMHAPICLDCDEQFLSRDMFIFEKMWTMEDYFDQLVVNFLG